MIDGDKENKMFIAHIELFRNYCHEYIGCNQSLLILKSSSREEALEELKAEVIGEWIPEEEEYELGYWNDDKIASITLFSVATNEDVPVEEWYKEAEEFKRSKENKPDAGGDDCDY
jgi:hypothetical protein